MVLAAKRQQHSQMRISLITPEYGDFHYRSPAIKTAWLQGTKTVDGQIKKVQGWVFQYITDN